jgi:2-polyprenyl-6-methoxyphenol hydroxylase-like FAD-dependent oxidoreductase
MQKHIAIAGCGVAGLACALFLHRAGYRVTLFERFAQPKPLGSGLVLQTTGLAVLSALGLSAAALARGQRIDRLFGLRARDGRKVLDVRYEALRRAPFKSKARQASDDRHFDEPYGIGVHRAALFDILFNAVLDESLAIESNVEIAAFEDCAGGRGALIDAQGRRLGPFDLVIDALGARSVLRAQPKPLRYGALWASLDFPGAPFDAHTLEQRYDAARDMVGVLPIGAARAGQKPQCAYFFSLRQEDVARWRADGLSVWKEKALRLWPQTQALLDQISDCDQLTFATYAHATLRAPARAGLAHLGDSAHCASPQLGQGANMALLDAYAFAQAARQCADLGEAAALYARSRRAHVRLYQALSRVFTPFYQSDNALWPLLRDELVSPLSRIGLAQNMLARIVAGTLIDPFGGRFDA